MFITKTKLVKCKRFCLRGINSITITPTTKTQIVLGTNGSGKSSLLKLGFSVIPHDNKDDFLAGGYKEVHCLHKGKEYVLRTDYPGKSPVHSFICDDEELNPGHTGAVQKELVRTHFGMTQELHNVLTGQLRFTDMNAIQRREWITALSSADFEYVVKLHGRIKKAVRDSSAVIKHLSGRLVNETGKKIDDTSLNQLRKQAQEITDKLITLHQNSKTDGLHDSLDEYRREYDELSLSVERLVATAMKLSGSIPTQVGTTDLDDINDVRSRLTSRLQMLEEALHELSDQYQEIDRKLHALDELNDVNPDQLKASIKELEERRTELEGKFKTSANVSRIPTNLNSISIIEDIRESLGYLAADSIEFTDQIVDQKQEQLYTLQQKHMHVESKLIDCKNRLDHVRSCQSVSCPNCNHSFKEGIGQDEEGMLLDAMSKGQVIEKTLRSQIDELKEWLQQAGEQRRIIRDITRKMEDTPDLIELWSLIRSQGGVAMGRLLFPLLNNFISDIKTHATITDIILELIPLNNKLDEINKASGNSDLREYAVNMADRINTIRENISTTKDSLKEVSEFQRRVIEVRDIERIANEARNRLDKLMEDICRFLKVEDVREQVRRHQSKLGALETTLAEAEVQMGVIRDLSSSLEEAKRDEIALIALEKILSPKDGIIAEQIMVFINTFISSINDVIAKVWGYNLALDKIDLDENDLDYKFPMFVHTTDNPIPDIQYGSDSQVDIVNQAFRLVVYKFMGLEGFPLYLDELGRTFDEVHRLNLTMAIKDLIADETFSQVFFISHSFEGQNSYPNSELIVMDEAHLSLKRKFNEHVVIE
jgi:energy-coupling factor transporter ATP-binding protein EcfA2